MHHLKLMVILFLVLVHGRVGQAETDAQTIGNDIFIAGSGPSSSIDAPRDVFIAGNAVTLKGDAVGDVHATGFDVEVETVTGGDLYAAGGAVTIRSSVGEDLTATGFSVRTSQNAITTGNARLSGLTITIDGPVSGALLAMGNEIILNARIGGDARIVANKINFGPEALIVGKLDYSSSIEIAIPARVISPDRIHFEILDNSGIFKGVRDSWLDTEYPFLPTVISRFIAFVITLAIVVIVGAISLKSLPDQVERLRTLITKRPGVTFLIGMLGLSMLFGMVPVATMTVVGLPFIPIVVAAIILGWILGYTLGAYTISLWIWQAFGGADTPTQLQRLVALALSVVVLVILNFIPFVGWVANYTLVLLGIGAITWAFLDWITGKLADTRMPDIK
jgi:hypothetical protein